MPYMDTIGALNTDSNQGFQALSWLMKEYKE